MNYCTHNEVIHYWKINIQTNHPMPENQTNHLVFKGKTLNGALDAAKRYCKNQNQRKSYQSWVGEVIYECDFYGRKI